MFNISSLKSVFGQRSTVSSPSSGLYHYIRENTDEKSRIHLRVDPDGTGTLIVNANRVMHLNPTAAFMAWMILEGIHEQEAVNAIQRQYRISKRQALDDLSTFNFQLSTFQPNPSRRRVSDP